MITKGIILAANNETGIYTGSDTKFLVRIPTFESYKGAPECIFEAPSLDYSKIYHEGDTVYVGFEDNSLSSPIILGHMHLEADNNVKDEVSSVSLNVSESAYLPEDTTIGGKTIGQIVEYVEQRESPRVKIIDIR